MDKIVLAAKKRGELGKMVKVLRREGKLPGVIYGTKMKPLPIALDLKEATKVLRQTSSSTLLYLDVDGEEYTTLVRERQKDFLLGHYMHIDFLAVSLTEKVRAKVSLSLEGEAPVLKKYDSLLTTGIDELEVESLPQDLVEKVSVDISVLEEIGDSIYVRDLQLPGAMEILTDKDELIVVVSALTLMAEELEAVVSEDMEEEAEDGGDEEEETQE